MMNIKSVFVSQSNYDKLPRSKDMTSITDWYIRYHHEKENKNEDKPGE